MTPLQHFDDLWNRCSLLTDLHAYLVNNATSVLQPDELLRAEWVARVSALDLYVHELVAQGVLDIFKKLKPATPAYEKFKISNDTLERIRSTKNPIVSEAAFDLEVRTQLSLQTYQSPDKIADGIRLFSPVDLWNNIALQFGATTSTQASVSKNIKKDLSLIVERRNKIAHEGDLHPSSPRAPWPILASDLITVKEHIEKIVRAIDSCV